MEVSPPAWDFQLLVAVGDEALNQGRALGISCSWETLGALGEEEQDSPHGPSLEDGGGPLLWSDPLGKGTEGLGWGGGNWD